MRHITTFTILFSLLSFSPLFSQFDDVPRSIVPQPMDEGNRREMTFPIQNGVSEATGNIVWSTDFTSMNNWIATGPPEMNLDNTFKVTTGEGTWYFDEWTSSTSGENYALFVNGDPTDETHVNGTYHLTYDSIFDLSALSNVLIEFEQYGARYYDKQLVEVSTDLGASWQVVGTNDDIFRLTYDGGVPYPSTMLRQYNITTAIADNPSQVMFRFTVDYNDNETVFGKSYGWFIDDLKIREGFEYDLKLVQAFTSVGENRVTYTKLTEDQTYNGNHFVNFGAIVKNEGSLPIEVSLKVTSSNGIERISQQSVLLQPNEQDTIEISGTNGMETYSFPIAQYNFHFELETTEQLQNTWNDTLNVPFEVQPAGYFNYHYNARDFFNGFPESRTGSIYQFEDEMGNDGVLGVVYHVLNSMYIGRVQVGIANVPNPFNHIGNEISGEIFKLENESLTFLQGLSFTDIQSNNIGSMIALYLNEYVLVHPGDKILVTVHSYGGLRIPLQISGLLPYKDVVGRIGGGNWFYSAPDEYYQNMTFAPVIRMLTTSPNSINENELTTKKINIYPNPSSETTVVSFSLSEQSTVSIDVIDVSGKVVLRIKETKFPEGEQQIPLKVDYLSSGVYTVVVYLNDGVYSEKLVVD